MGFPLSTCVHRPTVARGVVRGARPRRIVEQCGMEVELGRFGCFFRPAPPPGTLHACIVRARDANVSPIARVV
jgi:hypothetical protein